MPPDFFSIFAHVLAPLLHWGPLPVLLLVCQVASIFLFLLGAWQVATRIFSDRRNSWGAVLLAACCFTLPVAGTSLSIMDPYLTARSFSTPLTLFALAAVIARGERRGDYAHRRRVIRRSAAERHDAALRRDFASRPSRALPDVRYLPVSRRTELPCGTLDALKLSLGAAPREVRGAAARSRRTRP